MLGGVTLSISVRGSVSIASQLCFTADYVLDRCTIESACNVTERTHLYEIASLVCGSQLQKNISVGRKDVLLRHPVNRVFLHNVFVLATALAVTYACFLVAAFILIPNFVHKVMGPQA